MTDSNHQSSFSQYEKIFTGLPGDFLISTLETFKKQWSENDVYRAFASRFCDSPDRVKGFRQIPFLPVSFFKTGPGKNR